MSHAYLFSGPRGCGKTTVARLVAKALNCERPAPEGEPCCECPSCLAVVAGEHLDVMEIDGASNRGIDQIRELKSHVSLAPFMGGRKIYILDEVHMLTQEAFNALLKTLEEPPPFVLFLFATTEPHKVPVTIRSRCQHIPFHRISAEDIVGQLRFVAEREGFEADASALWEVARSADGALRDALSLTEQALALGNGSLTMDAVTGLFGGGSRSELEKWTTLLRTDPAEAQAFLKVILDRGASPERFLDALFPLLRDMWVYSLWGERSFGGVSLSDEEKAFLAVETPHWSSERLRRACAVCAALFPRARWGLGPDVFSGLLLLELLGEVKAPAPEPSGARLPSRPEREVMPEPKREPERPEREVTPEPKREPERPEREVMPEPKREPERFEREVTPEPKREPERPEREVTPESSPAESGELPRIFESFWRDDLPLCAAMLGVSIEAADGTLVIDYSNATQLARTFLESPRAQQTLMIAFGVEKPAREAEDGSRGERGASKEEPEAVGVGRAPKTHQKRKKQTEPSAMSLAELAAYLDGEILVEKPLDMQDLEELTEL